MMGIVQFSKVAPHLVNPLVLVGFVLFLFFGIHRALLKSGLLEPLSQRQSSAIMRLFLKYGFRLAILTVVLGFALACFQAYQDASREHVQQRVITQQAGPCGLSIIGDNNKANVNCVDKGTPTKTK